MLSSLIRSVFLLLDHAGQRAVADYERILYDSMAKWKRML